MRKRNCNTRDYYLSLFAKQKMSTRVEKTKLRETTATSRRNSFRLLSDPISPRLHRLLPISPLSELVFRVSHRKLMNCRER